MKQSFTYIFTIFIITQASIVYANTPKAIENINPSLFSGLWYEMARTYNSFEKDCVAATVEYKLVEPLKYEIKNRCFEKNIGEKLIEYNGTAVPSKGNNMSEIDMTYFWLFTKRYKIIYLDDYESAVLVDNDLEYVWIMNRKPFMQKEKLYKIVGFLEKYMDTSKLIYTPQDKQGRYK
ncbi:lipocalin family protein [Poseidonibacter antarcticus]|uniref:lipocalin family protein n=1 Tax=Poseidonibacter antarcticus TaxID=2478538 RepID=UPI000EF53F47|nr:lipocalin family protein [Poseidonibacter antarcticus]